MGNQDGYYVNMKVYAAVSYETVESVFICEFSKR